MHRILCLSILILFSLCPIVASEENTDISDENTNTRIGPEFSFDCNGDDARPEHPINQYIPYGERPDLPSGDTHKHLECQLYNPNDFNITVSLSVPLGIDIWSPDQYCVDYYSYGWDSDTGMWGIISEPICNNGKWLIQNGNSLDENYSYELVKNETIYSNLTIFADSLYHPMQPGFQEINLTTRITKTQWLGDNETLCQDCTTINYTSTQFFNEWWNIDVYTDLTNCYLLNRGYYSGDMLVIFDDFCDDVGMANAVEVLTQRDFIDVRCFQQQKYVYTEWNPNAQTTNECDFEVDSRWQQLFNSSKLDQTKMLDSYDGDDYYYDGGYYSWWDGVHHYEEYIDRDTNEEIDYWGSRQCPEQIPITVSFDVMGNTNFTKNGKIQLISHQYSLNDGLTIHNISNQTFEISSNNTPNLAYNIPLSQSDEENLLIIIEGKVILENESYDEIILGACLTRFGADSLNEIYEEAALTMGISGGPLQRISNSIAYSIGVDSFVVVGFFSMCIPPILYLVLTRMVKRINEEF
tara:strand:+ start:743 stop:2314 length:1572 start_codon:yes stop_codon:yes gene_type:complete